MSESDLFPVNGCYSILYIYPMAEYDRKLNYKRLILTNRIQKSWSVKRNNQKQTQK